MAIITQSDLEKRILSINNHNHPVETASAPDMVSRRAAASFTTAANNENLVLDGRTYTFKTALTAPAAGNVYVKVQGTVALTIAKLAEAIRGVVDVDNIAYATGEGANPTVAAYYTTQRFAIGATNIPAGNCLFILEKAEDVITAITFTTTSTATLTAFARVSAIRYILNGNAAGAGGINSIRGAMHTVLPVGSVVLGGQSAPAGLVAYDCHRLTLTQQSDSTEKEMDLYYSFDEVTFTRIARSITFSHNLTAAAMHVSIDLKQGRIPKGAGLYIKVGSGGTSAADTCDIKLSYHLYPVNLS